jgi:hypothetical protein
MFQEDIRKRRVVTSPVGRDIVSSAVLQLTEEWWVRVTAVRLRDPISGRRAILLNELDVSDLKMVEGELTKKKAIDNAESKLNAQNDEGAQRVLMDLGLKIDKKIVHAEDDELSDVAPDEDEHELQCIADGAHSELGACLERADGLIFDVWELSDLSGGHALSTLALHLFRKYNLFSTFGLNMEKVPRHALQLCGGCSFGRLLRIRQSRRS